MNDRPTQAMAAIAGTVAAASALSPRTLLRAFGIAPAEVTGAAAFGWRLFAVRTGYVAVQALRADASATASFLPIQAMDQVVFWHAYRTRSVPRRAAVLAAVTSGAIVALDLRRRAA